MIIIIKKNDSFFLIFNFYSYYYYLELDVPIKSLIKSMNKHHGLSQPNLLSILFPPPKISYPNSSASSLHLSRRSSMTTQRTFSLQSNSTSIYSARYHNNNSKGHSSSIIKILKGWIGARDHKQTHHASTSLSSSSISTSSPVSSSTSNNHNNININKNQNHIKQNKTHPHQHHPYHKTTIFSWATVTVKFPKKNHGTLYRFFFQHPKLSSQARQKSKMLVVGKRVQLTRRPVLTVGTVKYVGPVLFAEGTWVGVELDRRGKKKKKKKKHIYICHQVLKFLFTYVFIYFFDLILFLTKKKNSWEKRWISRWRTIFHYFTKSWCFCSIR